MASRSLGSRVNDTIRKNSCQHSRFPAQAWQSDDTQEERLFFCRSLKGNNLRVLETVKSCSALSVSQRRGSKVNLNSLANCLTEIQCALLASWITLQASWEAAAAGASCVRAGPCSVRRTRVQEDPADVPARSPPTGTPHSACSALPPCLRERLQSPAAGWRAPVRKSQPF